MFTHRERIGSVDLAFTDRFGGVGAPPHHELDLALAPEGRHDEIEANWRLVLDAFAPGARRADMRQVHGAAVVSLTEVGAVPPECDGLVTTAAATALVVRAADCVPLLLADPDAGVVGAAHAGRAGLVAGVVGATVARMREAGARRIVARIGPHVCGRCYEVPQGLRDEVAAALPEAAATTSWGTPSLDLAAGVCAQLHRAEVAEIMAVGPCTLESRDHHSYRRDGERAGRQVGLIVLRCAQESTQESPSESTQVSGEVSA